MGNHQPGCSAKDQTHGENLGMHRRTGMSLDTAAPRELGPHQGEGFWGIQLLLCRGRRNLPLPAAGTSPLQEGEGRGDDGEQEQQQMKINEAEAAISSSWR